jgi:hypothetical protein
MSHFFLVTRLLPIGAYIYFSNPIQKPGRIIVGIYIDEIMIAFLKTLAVCVIIGGILAVPAQLLHSTGTNIYVPFMETDLSIK